jgi:hypothetical protein
MEASFNGRVIRSGVFTDASCRMLPKAELWTAVIQQAIQDLSSPDSYEQEAARLWFNAPTDVVGSFIWACNVIDMEPSFIRASLHKQGLLKRQGLIVRQDRKQHPAELLAL